MSVQPDQLREPSREQLEAAAKVMNDEGFDIRFPWECTLDDVEQHRYETFSKAIAAALPPLATGAAEPVAWQPIETAPQWLRDFAKECEVMPDRSGFVEFGGTMEDGRGFLLLRKDAAEKIFDRWLRLPPFSAFATPPVRGDREEFARAIDPEAFELSDKEIAPFNPVPNEN